MTFTPDINLGNLMVTGALGVIGVGIRRVYKLLSTVIEQHEQAMEDIDDHAEVINLHTTILVDAGMVKGPVGIPRVDERRIRARIHTV